MAKRRGISWIVSLSMAPFIYLINGKRLKAQAMDQLWNRAPGVYIVPGSAAIRPFIQRKSEQ